MIGQTISHYKILDKIGEGGMGVVYKARDTKLDRMVALKFLPEHAEIGPLERERFLREAKAAAALSHPNVCVMHSIEQEGAVEFLAMEFVDGKNLRASISSGPLDEQTALRYARQIAEALSEAHHHGIVHRDLKPENIIVGPRGQVKITDFGLAKLKGSVRLTRTTSTVGTLAYMAPELIQGEEATPASDIFSFGILLFEILTGVRPFQGEHEAALIYSILNEEPKTLRSLRPGLPPGIQNIVAKALKKDPTERYQSFGQLLHDLRNIETHAKPVGTSKRTIMIIAVGAVVILTGTLYYLMSPDPAGSPSSPTVPDTVTSLAESKPVPDVKESLPPKQVQSVDTQRQPVEVEKQTPGQQEPVAAGPSMEEQERTRSPDPKPPAPGDAFVNSLGMEFILLPEGEFRMGADDPEAQSDEAPVHPVKFSRPLWFGKHEVTNAQFAAFVTATQYRTTAETVGWSRTWDQTSWTETKGASWRTFHTGDSLPVVCVSWNDAKAFAQWLNEKEGTYQYRLPTEAEWEYAARAGTKQHRYCWGNDIPVAQKGGNIADETFKSRFSSMEIWPGYYDGHVFLAPVGSFLPNDFGLYDMTGNVWEWCEDWYDTYPEGKQTDPTGPRTGSTRVLRGGSWKESPRYVRAANRTRYAPDYKSSDTGFRLVKTARR